MDLENVILIDGKPIYKYISEMTERKAQAHVASKFSRCLARELIEVLRPARDIWVDFTVDVMFTFLPEWMEQLKFPGGEAVVANFLKKKADKFIELFVTTLIRPAHFEVLLRVIYLLAEDIAYSADAIARVMNLPAPHGGSDPGLDPFVTDLFRKLGLNSYLKSTSFEGDKEAAERWARLQAQEDAWEEQKQNENQTKTNDMHMLFESWRKY